MKATLIKIGRAIVAGLTSTEAVKAEKSVAVLVAVRILIAIGASDALVRMVEQLAH